MHERADVGIEFGNDRVCNTSGANNQPLQHGGEGGQVKQLQGFHTHSRIRIVAGQSRLLGVYERRTTGFLTHRRWFTQEAN